MIFTSLAWGAPYRAALERLRDSAARWAVPVDLHVRDGEPPDRGSALRLKPEILLYELLVHDRAVWVDADGVFRAPWDYEMPDGASLALPEDRGLWGAHVMVWTRDDAALHTLEAWCWLMKNPAWDGNEMTALNQALKHVAPSVYQLPIRFAWVESWHYNRHGRVSPVLETNVALEKEGCCR